MTAGKKTPVIVRRLHFPASCSGCIPAIPLCNEWCQQSAGPLTRSSALPALSWLLLSVQESELSPTSPPVEDSRVRGFPPWGSDLFGGGCGGESRGMAEAIYKDSFRDLKELENKVGRKTPESLLLWMRDAADRDTGRRSGGGERRQHGSAASGSIADKISYLKEEMVKDQTVLSVTLLLRGENKTVPCLT